MCDRNEFGCAQRRPERRAERRVLGPRGGQGGQGDRARAQGRPQEEERVHGARPQVPAALLQAADLLLALQGLHLGIRQTGLSVPGEWAGPRFSGRHNNVRQTWNELSIFAKDL